jgi:hypothetical protein
MYPQRELSQLAAHKTALQHASALHRAQCAKAAARVAQPFERLDRMMAFWRRLSPLVQFASVPLGFLATRTVFPRRNIIGSLVRWVPLAFGAVCGINSMMKTPRRDS